MPRYTRYASSAVLLGAATILVGCDDNTSDDVTPLTPVDGQVQTADDDLIDDDLIDDNTAMPGDAEGDVDVDADATPIAGGEGGE